MDRHEEEEEVDRKDDVDEDFHSKRRAQDTDTRALYSSSDAIIVGIGGSSNIDSCSNSNNSNSIGNSDNNSNSSSSKNASAKRGFDVSHIDAATAIKDFMDIPSNKASFVIGKGGSAINAIMEQSSCRVSVDLDQGRRTRRVIVIGNNKEAVLKAKELVARVLVEGPGFLVPLSQLEIPKLLVGDVIEDRSDIMIPFTKVATVIGSKGVVVSEIFRRTGCKVLILQEGVPAGHDRPVSFIGTPAQIIEAKALVTSILQGGANALLSAPSSSSSSSLSSEAGSSIPSSTSDTSLSLLVEEEDIDQAKISLVIGTRGAVLSSIMTKSNGCKILIKQKADIPAGTSPKIIYTGTADQISLAKSFVSLVKEKGPGGLDRIPDPSHMHHSQLSTGSDSIVTQSIISSMSGQHGLINELQRYLKITISFEPLPNTFSLPDPQSRVVLQGDPQGIRIAKSRIENFIAVFNKNTKGELGYSLKSQTQVVPHSGFNGNHRIDPPRPLMSSVSASSSSSSNRWNHDSSSSSYHHQNGSARYSDNRGRGFDQRDDRRDNRRDDRRDSQRDDPRYDRRDDQRSDPIYDPRGDSRYDRWREGSDERYDRKRSRSSSRSRERGRRSRSNSRGRSRSDRDANGRGARTDSDDRDKKHARTSDGSRSPRW